MRYLSIDAGGTFIKYAWINECGEILSQGKKPTPRTTKEDFLKTIKEIWDSCTDKKEGIAVSLPGTIEPEKGFIYQGGSLRYHNQMQFKKEYEEYFQVPVEVENDARCAAIAEMAAGNMKGIHNGIVLTFGTGVGGCFVLNGEIYRGTHLFSGEVSALICKDLAQHGADALLGNMAGIALFSERVRKAKGVEEADGKVVFEWIKEQDEVACALFKEYCSQVAVQLFNMQIMLDPQRVCIGGGVSANETFIKGLQDAMEAFYKKLPVFLPHLEIVSCKHHNDANLLGAFYHFIKKHPV